MRDILWNSERFIVFQTVILQRARHVTASQVIRRRTDKRLNAREAGSHGILVEETLCTCAQYLNIIRREESEDHRSKTYHSLVLQGKLRTAVWWITDQEMVGVLNPAELCTNTKERVMDVLCTKHPDARPPAATILDTYQDRPPELVPVDTNNNKVTKVSG